MLRPCWWRRRASGWRNFTNRSRRLDVTQFCVTQNCGTLRAGNLAPGDPYRRAHQHASVTEPIKKRVQHSHQARVAQHAALSRTPRVPLR